MSFSTSNWPPMAPFPAQVEQIRYRYRPWAVNAAINTDVPVDSDCLSNSATTIKARYAEPRSGLVTQPNEFQSFTAQPGDFQSSPSSSAFDSSRPSSSHKTKPQHQFGDAFATLQPYYSPSPSASSYTSCESRVWSDCNSGSWNSPDVTTCYSPQPRANRGSLDIAAMVPPHMRSSGSCISLSDVQQFAETTSDAFQYDYPMNEFLADSAILAPPVNFSLPHSTIDYDPRTPATITFTNVFAGQDRTHHDYGQALEHDDSACASSLTPHMGEKKQRHKHSRSVPAAAFPSGITKKSNSSCQTRRLSAPVDFDLVDAKNTSPSRSSESVPANASFPCPLAPYGCTSCFGSKNEWKRHVNTQHLRLDLWRCDQCIDRDTRPNDFNRKDLFIQHLRRMHYRPDEEAAGREKPGSKSSKRKSLESEDADPALVAAEQRCHLRLRLPPSSSSCLFCPANFDGPGSWDERMEHVGRHLEQGKKDGKEAAAVHEWRLDKTVEEWLQAEGLISRIGYEWQITDGRRNSTTRS